MEYMEWINKNTKHLKDMVGNIGYLKSNPGVSLLKAAI